MDGLANKITYIFTVIDNYGTSAEARNAIRKMIDDEIYIELKRLHKIGATPSEDNGFNPSEAEISRKYDDLMVAIEDRLAQPHLDKKGKK